ncbi:transcriptional regulator [Halorubrum californiense DSM 19288]|uniref:Transcriptional regulator n=1 Tax=Halorubrum californiense DSM 19288 TaxID=1227465 RepID=M0E0N1_9EURY|nr:MULTISPECIES: transcriptional regulator [Halorubrum]ELZ40583.1 transcriptional regulator [Halorubrum californiense DSM 19288]TKX72866.1 ArsR family transcriptional regulator [Halorubrum sp. GN11GM_10-3_MGM]
MTDDGPAGEFGLAEGFGADLDAEPADERVYRIALQLYDPAGVSAIAERASCAPDTARRHLKRLADIGVVERVSASPLTFVRNESYFEWRLRNRLEALSRDELHDRLADLTEREREFRERFDADSPTDVDALKHADYDDVETVWLALSEWRTVRDRIDRLEAVRRDRGPDPSAGENAA